MRSSSSRQIKSGNGATVPSNRPWSIEQGTSTATRMNWRDEMKRALLIVVIGALCMNQLATAQRKGIRLGVLAPADPPDAAAQDRRASSAG